MPAIERFFDPVQVAQAGSALVGLEGAAATGAGGVLLWGWLFDPDRQVEGFTCELGGRTLSVELLDRTPRPDVVELHAAVVRSRTPEVGFLAFAQADPELLRSAGGRIRLEVRTSAGSASTANRLLFEPGSGFEAVVGRRLPLDLMRPAAIARAAEALWAPEAARVLATAGDAVQLETHGPNARAELSLVAPLGTNARALRETLVYLDMGGGGDGLEVVLSLTRSDDAGEVAKAVRAAGTGLRIVTVPSGEDLSVGAAARLGVEAATAPSVLLMSDAVVPPSGLWLGDTLADLAGAALLAPRSMPRFDGLPERYGPTPAGEAATAWPHDDVRTRLRTTARRLGLDAWSPGLVVGRRDALLALPLSWSEMATPDGFWGALLAHAVQAGVGALRAGDRFTVAPVEAAPADGATGRSLMDAYLLDSRFARLAISDSVVGQAA